MKTIVSAVWLNENINQPNLIILDATLNQNAQGNSMQPSEVTIPNARFFDLKNVFRDKDSPFPNTIPKPDQFERDCRHLGINKDSEIVVFDANGIYSSPRVWWLFKVMGHDNIAILDGGLPNWIKHNFQTQKKHNKVFKKGNFEVAYKPSLVIDFKQVTDNVRNKAFTIVDARSESRFNGTGKEPRAHLKSGRIENSVNIPYQEVLSNGSYKSKTELAELFKNKCTPGKELVFSCGSGITACIVMLASQMGYETNLKVYDGSWTEWAERNAIKNDV